MDTPFSPPTAPGTGDLPGPWIRALFATFLVLGLLHVGGGGQLERYVATSRALLAGDGFDVQRHVAPGQVDVLWMDGRAYTVAPPGVGVVLVGPLALARALAGPLEARAPGGFAALVQVLLALGVTAPLLAGATVAMQRLLQALSGDVARGLWGAVGFAAGTGALVYTTHGVWGHGYALCGLALALSGTVRARAPLGVGAALALALLADYAAAVPVAGIVALWGWRELRGGLRAGRLLALAAPLVLAAGALLAHNAATTGHALVTLNGLYRAQLAQESAQAARGMFALPDAGRLWGLTFSPFRGVFLYTPLALAVLVQAARTPRRFVGPVQLVCAATVLAVFGINLTYYAWSGDSCFGPRHLLNAMPFVVALLAWCDTRLLRVLVPASVFVNVAGANTPHSESVFVNLAVFLYRGPHSGVLEALRTEVLPVLTGVRLAQVTPFAAWAVAGGACYWLWRRALLAPAPR